MPNPNPQAFQSQILATVQSLVQSLGLVYTDADNQTFELPGEQVYLRKIFVDRGLTLPCVQIFYGNLPEEIDYEDSSFENTTLIYKIGAAYVFASNQDYTPNNDELYWRQQLINAFLDFPNELNETLAANVSEAIEWDCQLDLTPPVDPDAFHDKNLDVGGMILKIKTTFPRLR